MKVVRKMREKGKYETKIPEMGRREIEQSKQALELLRSNRFLVGKIRRNQ